MNVKVGRVAVVIARLLKVNAVGPDMSRKLRLEDVETQRTPALRVSKLRKQQPEIKKAERFARQVCVG
jgi:hypothetical protein